MYYEENYNAVEPNDIENEIISPHNAFENAKKHDKGFNIIYRKFIISKTGEMKKKRVYIYTSGSSGNRIRDAETGTYYSNKVGSKDEDIFFKVILPTGECTSANGSSTLFYNSPEHYMNHQNSSVDPEIIARWGVKRNERLAELNLKQNPKIDINIIH